MRKKDIKVSIVVPSLNVKPYINECIDSIIAQSLDEIEIICVDAKSEDGTLEALKQYEASGIIKLITSDVRSYGVQMNMGIHEAKGEYVGFVESDDFIDEFMYEKLYKCACNNDADVVMSDYIMFEDYNGGRNEYLKRIGANQNMYNQILCPSKNAVMLRGNYINPTGLFRKTFLEENNIFFNETPGAAYQDVGFFVFAVTKS
jgi:glycosyltransferase involved in cell wall biosynthesis